MSRYLYVIPLYTIQWCKTLDSQYDGHTPMLECILKFAIVKLLLRFISNQIYDFNYEW